MQTEKSQPSSQRIMPERRSTSFLALSVYPRVGIFGPASKTDDTFYFSHAKFIHALIVIHCQDFLMTFWARKSQFYKLVFGISIVEDNTGWIWVFLFYVQNKCELIIHLTILYQ